LGSNENTKRVNHITGKKEGIFMKKFILALLLVLIASPVWAIINITATDLGGGIAAIDYSGTELARAFALDITVDEGIIEDINDFATGDENNGYGIFPANFKRHITISDTGQVDSWIVKEYTPVADANDPDALGGLGTAGVTIEMGSLYVTAAPPLSGRLCTVKCSKSCLLTVAVNSLRGSVVLEDANQATVALAGATNIPIVISSPIVYTGLHPEQWEAVGKPECWVSLINPRQCHGDADGLAQGLQNYWVSINDLIILIEAWNKPLSELTGNQICADFDNLPQSLQDYRISTNDLDILIANWNLANGPPADCP
jgi:hypothetical protein